MFDRLTLPRPLAVPATVTAGVLLALATAVISGVSVYVNSFAVKHVADPAVFTTLKNAVVAVLLVGLVAGSRERPAVRTLDRRRWAGLVAVGFVGGSIPFLLFFTGLAQASAPSAAFIHKTLFVWVALLAVPLLGERLGALQVAAVGLLFAGQVLIQPPTGITWGTGETLIAIATLLWSVEIIVARRLLATVGSTTLAAGRMGFGLVFLVLYLVLAGRLDGVLTVTATGWAWILATAVFLLGYVVTWYAALQRAPATVVTSVLVLGAPITGAIQSLATGKLPAPAVLAAYVLIVVGAVVFAMAATRLRGRPSTA